MEDTPIRDAALPGAVADEDQETVDTEVAQCNVPKTAGPTSSAKAMADIPRSPSPILLAEPVKLPVRGPGGMSTTDVAIHDRVVRKKKRRVSDPPVKNFFDGKDASMDEHLRHDRESQAVINHLSSSLEVEDVMGVITMVDARRAPGDKRYSRTSRIYSHLRNYQQVESERLMLKIANGECGSGPTLEAWQEGDDPLPVKRDNLRAVSKESRVSRISRKSSRSQGLKDALSKEKLDTMDWLYVALIAFVAVVVVVVMSIWSKAGGLLAEHGLGHHITVKTRQGHMTSAIYKTPVVINLVGTETEYFEVRLIGMATMDMAASHDDAHRRLAERHSRPTWQPASPQSLRRLTASGGAPAVAGGTLTYQLYKCNTKFYEKTIELLDTDELEHFQDVDVAAELAANTYSDAPGLGQANCEGQFYANVTSNRPNGEETAFMLQVLRMNSAGRHRQVIGIVIFVITFISIVSEKIHRSYSAVMGASSTLCAVAAIQETPHLHTIGGMVDWGTLMLLFSMMILMRMLAVTGFFNWFAVKVVQFCGQNTKVLFFALTNICGVLSMVLDNVTCVMLFGPLTYRLCQELGLNPRYLYLSMTICATVGGTATLIGDPPNVVIGSKIKIDFGQFIICNMPIVVVVMLPLSSVILYYRVKDMLHLPGVARPKLDLVSLRRENRITDQPMFAKLMAVLLAILLFLCLSPVHRIEPSWLTCMGMFACAILFERHKFGKYLEFVEWDTLLFFALLFVLVESLSELGVIRLLGEWIIAFIEVFPEDSRLPMAIIIILWVSSVGSAFLESLPYTTTIVYVLLDLQRTTIAGIDDPGVLVWPLSVGACVGGIGSIMGSSANLVCMAVSERATDQEKFKVQGGDFLKYGLPTMLILVVFAMFWQLFLFVALGVRV